MTINSKTIEKELREIGMNIYRSLKAGRYPSVDIPLSGTTNIKYDKNVKQYVLGEKISNRSSGNMSGAKPMMHLSWLANRAHGLVSENVTTTMRDIYYLSMHEAITKYADQNESDNIIFDLERILGRPRESFGIEPGDRNTIFGDVDLRFDDPKYKKPISCLMSPDGFTIGPSLARAKILKTKAKKVIVVEKTGIFNRCIEDGTFESENAIIIDSNGQASRNARFLLSRLALEAHLPVYIFTDADPWGMHIAQVLISGSANSAHLTGLNIPNAKWLGVYASDIVDWGLPGMPLKETDINRCKSNFKDPRYKEGIWKRETEKFLKIKQKAELEAFDAKGKGIDGLKYITREYIPRKLREAEKKGGGRISGPRPATKRSTGARKTTRHAKTTRQSTLTKKKPATRRKKR